MRFATPTSRSRFRLKIAPFDLVWAIATPFIALGLRDPTLLAIDRLDDPTSPALMFAAIAIASTILAILAFRLSDGMTHLFTVRDLVVIATAVAASTAVTTFFLFTLTRLSGVPRSTPTIFAMVLGSGLVMARALHRATVDELARTPASARPDILRNILIIGADRFAINAVRLIGSQTPPTARALALLDSRPNLTGRVVGGVRVAGAPSDLEPILDEYGIHGIELDQVLVSDDSSLSEEASLTIARVCEERQIEFLSLAEAFNLHPKSRASAALATAPARPAALSRYFELKRIVDIAASVILLTLLSPLTIFVATLVLIDVGTPVLFWQERIGRNGRRFLVHKFRTYSAPVDARNEPIPPEQRLSKIGRFIRATRVDEIPQLLNVLVGEMSLIGPRPLLPRDQPDDPATRLLVRPGITGWAQVKGGNLVTPEQKDALDAWYIENASFWLDLKILILTLVVAVTGERFDREAVEQALALRGAQQRDRELALRGQAEMRG